MPTESVLCEERETNKMQLIWCLLSNFYLNMFRASPYVRDARSQEPRICVLQTSIWRVGGGEATAAHPLGAHSLRLWTVITDFSLSQHTRKFMSYLTWLNLAWTNPNDLLFLRWRERDQQDATNLMFIIKLSQHVSGIIMPIIRRTIVCTAAYGVLHW